VGRLASLLPVSYATGLRQCLLQVIGNILQQVETFKYPEVVFASDGSRNRGIDTRIGKANAVQRQLLCTVMTKWELSKTTKLSVLIWVVAER